MQMKCTILIRQEGPGADRDLQEIGRYERPADKATPADFGLARAEGQALLTSLQRVVTQQQVSAIPSRPGQIDTGAFKLRTDSQSRPVPMLRRGQSKATLVTQ